MTASDYNKKEIDEGRLTPGEVSYLISLAKQAGEAATNLSVLLEVGTRLFQKSHGLTQDGCAGPVTQAKVEAILAAEAAGVAAVSAPKPVCLDLTAMQPNPPPPVRGKVKHKIYRGKVVERKPKNVIGIVIHQTACVFGGPDPLSRHKRALGVACHALAFRDGTYVMANPLSWYVWHGNGFNAYSLGLEIEGHYSGLADDPETPRREDIATTWRQMTPTPLTDLTILTARAALKELVDRGRAAGMPIEYIWAHRQSSDTRRSDPGELLWKAVVVDYAVPVLGLKIEPARVEGDGYPIPKAWDPNGVGNF